MASDKGFTWRGLALSSSSSREPPYTLRWASAHERGNGHGRKHINTAYMRRAPRRIHEYADKKYTNKSRQTQTGNRHTHQTDQTTIQAKRLNQKGPDNTRPDRPDKHRQGQTKVDIRKRRQADADRDRQRQRETVYVPPHSRSPFAQI